MKATYVLALLLSVSCVYSAPTTNSESDSESVDEFNFEPALMRNTWLSFEKSFKTLQKEIEETSRRLEEKFKQFDNSDFKFNVDINFADPKNVKNETFQEEKVVGDHIISTKEQVFSNGNSIFHVKRVQIVPEDLNKTRVSQKPIATQPKEIANIPDKKKDSHEFIASTTERDVEEIERHNLMSGFLRSPLIQEETVPDVYNFLIDSFENAEVPQQTNFNLAGDIDVNSIAENHIRVTEPDAELIDVNQINSNTNNDPQRENKPNTYYKYSTY